MATFDVPSEHPCPSESPTRIALIIPFSTYVSIIGAFLLMSALFAVWPLLQLIALGALIAATLSPLVDYLQGRGLSRNAALGLVITAFLALILGFFAIILPSIYQQASNLSRDFPAVRDKLQGRLPEGSFLHQYIQHLAEASGTGAGAWYDQLNWAGGKVLNALGAFGLLLVVAIYLLVDGPKLFRWFLAFFSFPTQQKFEETAAKSSEVVSSYFYGQAITSGLVMVFAFITLFTLKVPAALILALCAGVLDIFPVVGFILAAGPAVLLALTVSPTAASIVAIAYVLYHSVENYFIVPRVYGKKLRLSTFTVLVSLLVGWELAGVAGALLALPLVASYAHIEGIWLTPYLNRRVSEKHEDQKDAEFGEKPGMPASSINMNISRQA